MTHEPNVRVSCMGGPLLEATGAEVVVDHRHLSVVGLAEVAGHARAIYRAWRTITSHLCTNPPKVLVLIDFPDFNFLLARTARRLGISVFYYISPQVWAWRSGRVRTIKRLVNEMAVILPFEAEFYDRREMEVHFVGHPLLDVLATPPPRQQVKEQYQASDSGYLIGLLPGSRQSEIRSLLPIFLDAAGLLHRQLPDISFIIPVAPSLDVSSFETALSNKDVPVRLVAGNTHGVVRACDLILTVSGTSTLEAAILETPMIIINRVSDLSYRLGRHLVRVKYIGLPNLIAGRPIVSEFIQNNAQPMLIACEALNLLKHPELLEQQRQELRQIRSQLGEPGAADRVAQLVLQMNTAGNSSTRKSRRMA
jgi:lipid-A-disaccharide synthase